jgi:hypothetical protein
MYQSAVISNSIGAELFSSTINVNETISLLDVRSLPAGIYFLRLVGYDNNVVKRIVKQ